MGELAAEVEIPTVMWLAVGGSVSPCRCWDSYRRRLSGPAKGCWVGGFAFDLVSAVLALARSVRGLVVRVRGIAFLSFGVSWALFDEGARWIYLGHGPGPRLGAREIFLFSRGAAVEKNLAVLGEL